MTRLDERSLSKLKWRCRRGLLENDLVIERFFRHHEETITTRQAEGLNALMDLATTTCWTCCSAADSRMARSTRLKYAKCWP